MTALPARARFTRSGQGKARTVGVAAVVLVVALMVRAWVAVSGNFYWDDLILVGRAGNFPLFSTDLLLYDHDGHFMPAAFVLAKAVTAIAPYDWTPAVVTLVLLQALAALAVFRLLRLLIGYRPILLAPLIFYLFSPLTLPSYSWWAAGLNSLPLQIGLAWVAGDAILLCRTGKRRYAVSGFAVFVIALLFFEKSVLVPFVAFGVVAAMYHVDAQANPLRRAWRGAKLLWLWSAGVTACWLVVYLVVVDQPFTVDGASKAVHLIERGLSRGLLPTLIGGPWGWERWQPSPPWADPSVLMIVLGWVCLLLAVGGVLVRKQRIGPVLLAVAAYVMASEVAMVLTRSGPDTSEILAQTLRYVADSAVVIAVVAALIVRALDRVRAHRSHRVAVMALAVAFLAGSLWSTATYVRSWRDNPTADYLATARTSLAEHSDVPMLDMEIPNDLLLPVVYPNNLASQVFSALSDRPEFTTSTSTLRSMDNRGNVVDADVSPTRAITQGPIPQCGYRIEGSTVAMLPLDGPLAGWQWTAQINYSASKDGELVLGLPDGDEVRVPVQRGLHQVFVRVAGSGTFLRAYPATPGLSICIGAGPVGGVLPELG